MKFLKTTSLILGLLYFPTYVQAQDKIFYENKNSTWKVMGIDNRPGKNPICTMFRSWKDGSTFVIYLDLADEEMYAILTNNQWDISDTIHENYKIQINGFTKNGDVINNLSGVYELMSKNTIRIRHLSIEFMQMFITGNYLQLIMYGSITNAKIPLTDSRSGVKMLMECESIYKK